MDKGKGNAVAPVRDLAVPRDPKALTKLAKAAALAQRDKRKSERVRRRASILHWLEESVFGYRMPLASKLIADAEWLRDGLGAFCWRCGVTRAPFEDVSRGCAECRDRSMAVRGIRAHGVVRLGRYAPPLSQWVPAIKQRAWRDMGVTLGRELGMQLADAIGSGLVPRPHVVVPVPVHWTRRLLRGIDHTRTIADEVARILAVPVAHPLRARLATRQTGAAREGRVRNMGRFEPRLGQLPSHCTEALVVDDVRTTGSTSMEALRALRSLAVEGVTFGVCAVSDPPRRSASGFGHEQGSRKCG